MKFKDNSKAVPAGILVNEIGGLTALYAWPKERGKTNMNEKININEQKNKEKDTKKERQTNTNEGNLLPWPYFPNKFALIHFEPG